VTPGRDASASDRNGRMRTRRTTLLGTVDVAATAVFGVEGAAAGALAGLDIVGVVVVGFCTALVGGIIRDVLLGDLPPAALRSPVRIVVALLASGAGFLLAAAVTQAGLVFGILDAAGLALFDVTGAQKAFDHGSNGWVVVMLGAITGVGGGVVRDVLLGRQPVVLTSSVYAAAAAAGALVFLLLRRARVPDGWALLAGFAVCFTVRVLALVFGWQLPHGV
jgi:uncharacterized membrane protein YeiH